MLEVQETWSMNDVTTDLNESLVLEASSDVTH